MDRRDIELYAQKIKGFYSGKKRMPSYSEMLRLFGLRSKNAVFKRVNALVRSGLFEKDAMGRLLPGKGFRPPLMLAGFIKAGFPSPAEEELRDTMSLDEYLIPNPSATYLLKVDGDSMIDAGIRQGDIVLVQKNLEPGTGDIVVAKIDNEWTLKYFEKKGKAVSLVSANRKYSRIIPRQELVIAGVVIANVRKYK